MLCIMVDVLVNSSIFLLFDKMAFSVSALTSLKSNVDSPKAVCVKSFSYYIDSLSRSSTCLSSTLKKLYYFLFSKSIYSLTYASINSILSESSKPPLASH